MNVRIVNKSGHKNPCYSTAYSAGMDLYANLSDKVVLKPLERKLISTGIYIELPEGFEAQVRPRSGLAIKKGISVLNTPGTIDADYRGEICVILINLSDVDYEVNDGDRIAQMVINKFEKIEWENVDVLNESVRGAGGFGHTGN